MVTKQNIVDTILKNKISHQINSSANAFASSNIALCKYWGKRNSELNLPVTNSLSISLNEYGTHITLNQTNHTIDELSINQQTIDPIHPIAKRLTQFLNLFRPHPNFMFNINSRSTIPIAAGLASSASAFAALVQALDQFFSWGCNLTELSILARLGSGSACRSLWPSFVEWQKGQRDDGMDSHGIPLDDAWDDLCLAIVMIDSGTKPISSREAMANTIATSPLYRAWPSCVDEHLPQIKTAIREKDIEKLGQTAEQNALAMHATMLASNPSIMYYQTETIIAMQRVWQCRHDHIPVYFTQDAGANLKLLFTKDHLKDVLERFPNAWRCHSCPVLESTGRGLHTHETTELEQRYNIQNHKKTSD